MFNTTTSKKFYRAKNAKAAKKKIFLFLRAWRPLRSSREGSLFGFRAPRFKQKSQNTFG
jgi:hypothetical protein